MGGIPNDCRPPPFGSDASKKRKLPPFGCNLLKAVDSFSTSGRVPSIVEECVASLDRRALDVEGIYSRAVDEEECRAMRARFFDGSKRPNMMTVANIHLVAACLLSYLKELDEPILTFSLYGRFLSISEESDSDPSLCERLSIRLLALPPINFFTAMVITQHLRKCVDRGDGYL